MCETLGLHYNKSLEEIHGYIFCVLLQYATFGYIAREITQFKVLHGQINVVFDFPPAEEFYNGFLLSSLMSPR